MTVHGSTSLRKVLLVEPDGLMRGTVASVCRDMHTARVRQTMSVASAAHWLKTETPDGLLISLAEGDAALDFLTQLRAGAFSCDQHLPVAAMARTADPSLVARLKELDVRRLLLQPFRLRDVINTLDQLWPVRQGFGV